MSKITKFEKEFTIPYYNWNSRSGIIRSKINNKKVGKLKFTSYRDADFENELLLEYLIIEPTYQSKGLGRKFLKNFLCKAQKEGITIIDLYALPIANQVVEIEKLRKFYRSFGFRSATNGNKSDMCLRFKNKKVDNKKFII
jgi:GNAT superfamily N-acetyltransferase